MNKGVGAKALNFTLLQIYYVTCDGTEDLKISGMGSDGCQNEPIAHLLRSA